MTEPAKKERQGPGRPQGQSGLREDILNAAETVFADFGYAGASLRRIAEQAGATTALINYYFGSKFLLYQEVFFRRAIGIAQARLENLRGLERDGKLGDVRAIVRAFLEPAINVRRTKEGSTFLRMQWGVHTEPKEVSNELRRMAYDESTHAYAAALHKALPHLPEGAVYARLVLMIGAALYVFSETHRLDELVPEIAAEDRINLIIDEMLTVFTAGIAAP